MSPPQWEPEITDENRHVIAANIIAKRQAVGKVTKAAVLIPLVLKEDGLSVLLTQRTNHLRDHAGQISFPGGRMDPEDQSPNDTALRESKEEIGLDSKRVEIIGHLPQYLTVSGYSVTPVVGLVQAQAEYVLDEFEVADVFEVPLRFLLDPANHQVRLWQSEQGGRRFYSMPYENRFIWGATAGMLRNLYHLLKV
jgi:8-oxo-dGTP pyrophosphatase MutT (NUDIX family)